MGFPKHEGTSSARKDLFATACVPHPLPFHKLQRVTLPCVGSRMAFPLKRSGASIRKPPSKQGGQACKRTASSGRPQCAECTFQRQQIFSQEKRDTFTCSGL